MPTTICVEATTRRRLLGRALLCAAVAAAVVLPSRGRGDTVRLRDGSTLRGRAVRMVADTLLFRLSFGGEVPIPRARIVWIDFTDSARVGAGPAVSTPAAEASPGVQDSGSVTVSFKDRGLSSKIVVTKKQDWEGHVRANWIVQTLLIDGREVATAIDSVTDKTIYKGPDKILKNEIELVDMTASAAAGPHECRVLVRNYGADAYRERFDGDPIDIQFVADIQVHPKRETRLYLGLDRGRLRTKPPRFYAVE